MSSAICLIPVEQLPRLQRASSERGDPSPRDWCGWGRSRTANPHSLRTCIIQSRTRTEETLWPKRIQNCESAVLMQLQWHHAITPETVAATVAPAKMR